MGKGRIFARYRNTNTNFQFFGITLNELCYEHQNFAVVHESKRKKTRYIYISILSFVLCWFVATIVFATLNTFFPHIQRTWLSFLYAIPVSSIVLIVLNTLWGKRIWNCLYVSILAWGTLLCICITITNNNTNWLYLIGIPFQIIIIVWYFFKTKIIEKLKMLSKIKKSKSDN